MKGFTMLAAVLVALPMSAQLLTPAAAPEKTQKEMQAPVAVVNGQTITSEQLDLLYARLGTQMRHQYDTNGGKNAFLENYLRKRLVVQEALKAGFDKRPDVQADMEASKESTLFDRYIRDVVAATVVPESEIRKYYDDNQPEFATPAKIKVRHIIIMGNGTGPVPKSKEDALEKIKKVYSDLRAKITSATGGDEATNAHVVVARFADAAERNSEDGSAKNGGDLGWTSAGTLDPVFEEAAFKLPRGGMSGIVETKFGYHLILVEDTKPAGTETYEEARPTIREFLLTQHSTDVVEAVTKLTNSLRGSSKISLFPENIR